MMKNNSCENCVTQFITFSLFCKGDDKFPFPTLLIFVLLTGFSHPHTHNSASILPILHHYFCKSASTWLVFITSQDMQLDDVWERNDLVTGLGIAVDWCYTDCRLILVLVHNSLGRISD